MGKRTFKALLCLDILLLVSILYFLYSGFYHWASESTWSGPGMHSLTIRRDFLAIVFLSGVIPVLLLTISKKPLWILQTVLIIVVSIFWKTDIMQQTLFLNQVSSTAREARIVKSFIITNEPAIEFKVKAINELMKDSLGKAVGFKIVRETQDLKYYEEAVGLKNNSYRISEIEFYNNIVKKIRLHIGFEGAAYHTSELTFYPENFDQWEPLSQTKYPLGTNVMVTCSRKYYFFGKKWTLYFEGLCFG
jgi:hypothetical protein